MTAGSLDHLTDGIEALADDAGLSHKLVVLVDDVQWSSGYFPALRALSGRDPVEQLLVLAPVASRFDSIVLSRPSERELVMQVTDDSEWFLERDRAHPFKIGDTVRVNRVAVEILQITADGRPTKVAFHFDARLEDDSIVWLGRLEPMNGPFPTNGRYPRWQPPSIGRTISVR